MKNNFYENLIKDCSWNKAAENVKDFGESQKITQTRWFVDKYGWIHSSREKALQANESYD